MHRILLVLGLAALLSPVLALGATQEQTLPNGLRVIVREDHRAPVVVSQIWYRVGSGYEHGGLTGISHVLEHMMFQGTPRHGPGQFSRLIAREGGQENAFTSRDYTAYYEELARDRLAVAFRLEADRMQHLTLDPTRLHREIKVVMEERRMRTEDKPRALTYEQFMAAAYEASPYHNPVIGWRSDIEHLTAADLRAWYRRWYSPANAILVVAGDVEPKAVFRLARETFGKVPRRVVAPPKPRPEPPQRGPRRITVKAPAELPYLLMGYKVPVLLHTDAAWKPYALEVLVGVLDGGNGARLSRDLVRGRQIAAGVGVGYDPYQRFRGLLTFSGTPAKGHTVVELEAALRKEVWRLRDQPVAADELARVKAQVLAAKVFHRDSVFAQAQQIGQLAAVGLDWHLADAYAARIRAVTAAQVQQVAREYLDGDGLTIAVLVPQPLEGRHPAHEGGREDVIR